MENTWSRVAVRSNRQVPRSSQRRDQCFSSPSRLGLSGISIMMTHLWLRNSALRHGSSRRYAEKGMVRVGKRSKARGYSRPRAASAAQTVGSHRDYDRGTGRSRATTLGQSRPDLNRRPLGHEASSGEVARPSVACGQLLQSQFVGHRVSRGQVCARRLALARHPVVERPEPTVGARERPTKVIRYAFRAASFSGQLSLS